MSVVEEYLKRTSTSKRLHDRARNVFPGGYTRGPFQHNPYPTYIKRAKGCRMWDEDGNEYIDYVNNYGPLILGHNDPKVLESVKQQLENFWLGAPAEAEIKLAEKVKELVPCAEKVAFCPCGSEACMKAIRTYRYLTGKDKVAMFDGGYHGASDSLFSSAPQGIPKDIISKIILMPFNNIEAVRKIVKTNKDELAAVMVEPTIGEMGHEPAKPDFYKAIREITEDNEVPLIFDEIVDGFRIAPGGAQEKFGVKADMATLAKILGGGFPLAAFTSSDETMSIWGVQESSSLDIAKSQLSHAGTFNEHKISSTAGLATINQLTPDTYKHLEKIGEDIRNGLKKICSDIRIKTQVVGISSIFHLYFASEPITDTDCARRANSLLYRYFELSMLNKGVNLGKAHSSFCSTPMTDSDVKMTLKAAEETLTGMRPVIKDIAPTLLEN